MNEQDGLLSNGNADQLDTNYPRHNSADRLRSSMEGTARTVSDAASRGIEKTEGAISSMGESISHFGDSIKQTLPSTGATGAVAASVADGLKTGGDYLKTHGFSEMSKDMTDLVRRHPVPAVWIGLGLGFVIGQALTRK